MKNINDVSLAAVHTHTHTHTNTCNFNEIKKSMQKYKNKSYISNKNGGITLIALVITIIILIILAGVSILAINKSNMFSKAKHATQEYQNTEQKEKNTLNEYEKAISNENKNIDTSVADKFDTWLLLVDTENAEAYSQEQILQNDELLNKLMNSDKAIDYMMKSKKTIMPAVKSSEKAIKAIQNSLKAKQKLIQDSDWKAIFEENAILPIFESTFKMKDSKDGVSISVSDAYEGNKGANGAADNDNSTGWSTQNGNHGTHWYQIEFDIPSIVTNYYLYGAQSWGTQYKFYLQASQDGKDWISLEGDTVHDGMSGYSIGTYNIKINNTNAYKYYKLYYPQGGWTYGSSGGVAIYELKLYGI